MLQTMCTKCLPLLLLCVLPYLRSPFFCLGPLDWACPQTTGSNVVDQLVSVCSSWQDRSHLVPLACCTHLQTADTQCAQISSILCFSRFFSIKVTQHGKLFRQFSVCTYIREDCKLRMAFPHRDW